MGTYRFEPTEIEPNQDATVDEGGMGIDGNDFDATAVARDCGATKRSSNSIAGSTVR